MEQKYKAVSTNDLVALLGAGCSPDSKRKGYVIGPDINGRICHCASCHSMAEAIALANKLNEKV